VFLLLKYKLYYLKESSRDFFTFENVSNKLKAEKLEKVRFKLVEAGD
jgi:hypothetical protein